MCVCVCVCVCVCIEISFESDNIGLFLLSFRSCNTVLNLAFTNNHRYGLLARTHIVGCIDMPY
jgi:hypothetical protein